LKRAQITERRHAGQVFGRVGLRDVSDGTEITARKRMPERWRAATERLRKTDTV
jgi:hypothetical protein